MKRWLVKSDPDEYSAADLERDRQTAWTGVKNPLAQKHLQAMSPGDAVLVYHTGDEKAVVATARVASAPRLDPAERSGRTNVVDLAFGAWLPKPVPLAEIKADPFFRDFALVRMSRLSVMPVSDEQWKRLLEMAGGETSRRG